MVLNASMMSTLFAPNVTSRYVTRMLELSLNNEKIPKALCNDSFIGYVHEFIVQEQVTWLEATIAGPVFSGVVTYYLEGNKDDKWGNLMDTPVGKAPRSWGVRGNIFLFVALGRRSATTV